MSSYIIAGSADSLDTAYCEEIARKIKSKYKNIDFRIVIKHPTQWQDYLQQICRIYGFLNKSNPIIYTYHGKIVGNKDAFIENAMKYFGLTEEAMIVPNLTNTVNIKLAEEELKNKNIQRKNIKSLQQKIDGVYQRMLKKGTKKHEFKDSQQFLINGIEYRFRDVEGICQTINFPYNKQIKIEKQVIEPDNIDLVALSAQDKIAEDGTKQAFVTNNQQLNTQSMEKMSEASRTNKLHSSAMSRDGDSKANKQSSKNKPQIDEQFDDVADYNDHNMEQFCISEVGDNFFLSFQKNNTHIPGEMVLYYNQANSNGNVIRIYNDGRGVIGHRTLIKEIHYENQEDSNQLSERNCEGEQEKQEKQEDNPSIEKIESPEKKKQEEDQKEGEQQKVEEPKVEAPKEEQKQKQKQQKLTNEKSKTEPNIPQGKQEVIVKKDDPEQIISEPHSDLNLVSNLNYHTLYILKPLSQQQLKRILYVVEETNTIACLQFLPENPNPIIKVYNRQHLMGQKNALLPIQKYISKQCQDQQYQDITLQSQQNSQEQVAVKKINGVGFTHYYYEHTKQLNDEKLLSAIRCMIDNLLNLEEKLRKQIGYNLIITKNFTMAVSITHPYKVYGNNSLYFDGLAYLGYVCIAKVVQGYQMNKKKIDSGETIREALARCSGYQLDD